MMSDRRPENPYEEEDREMSDTIAAMYTVACNIANHDPADVLAFVRRGVESGTIKGEVVDWCRVHRGNPRDCEHKAVYDEFCDVTRVLDFDPKEDA